MITIIAIALTWYATKVYYTKQFIIEVAEKDPTMSHIQCSGCSQIIYTNKENFRVPYYCMTCG